MSEQKKEPEVIEGEVTTETTETTETPKKESKINNDVLIRIFITLLFALIGWISLWVFGIVVLVQFGFLLITGNLNKNLKAFNGELGDFLADIIRYVSFQTDEKPFPFKSWHYDDERKAEEEAVAK